MKTTRVLLLAAIGASLSLTAAADGEKQVAARPAVSDQVEKLRIKQNVVIHSVRQEIGLAVDSQNCSSFGFQVTCCMEVAGSLIRFTYHPLSFDVFL